jgi:hypothetical protein
MLALMKSAKFRFPSALTANGWQEDVEVAVDAGGMIAAVTPGGKEGQQVSGIAGPGREGRSGC